MPTALQSQMTPNARHNQIPRLTSVQNHQGIRVIPKEGLICNASRHGRLQTRLVPTRGWSDRMPTLISGTFQGPEFDIGHETYTANLAKGSVLLAGWRWAVPPEPSGVAKYPLKQHNSPCPTRFA